MKHNWEYKVWNDVLRIINGKNQKSVENPNGIYPIYGSGGIMGYADEYICPENSTIIGRKGSINNPIYVTTKFWNVDTAFGIVAYAELLAPRYLYYFCVNYDFMKHNKATTLPSLVKSDLLKITMPVPPMDVQERIVAELDKINELIEFKRQQLKQLDLLAQSLFYDTFGDPVTNPKSWLVKTWGEVLTVINGKNQKAVENPNGQYPIYGSGGIMNYADDFLCPEFCTIIGRKGNISKPIFVKTKFWNVDTAFGLNANREVLNPLYLFYFCKNYDFEKHNKAVTIPSLVKKDLLKIYIPIPTLALQKQFAKQVEAIEAQKATVEKSIAELQTLLDSRMDYWFN